MNIFAFIGGAVVGWWLTGVVMFAFFVPVYVHPRTPLGVKLMTVAVSGVVMPWFFITHGRLPNGAAITPNDLTEEEWENVKASFCNCPHHRAMRGEDK